MDNSALPIPQQRTALPTRSRPLSMLPTPRSVQQSGIPAPAASEISTTANHRVSSSSSSSNGSVSPSRSQPGPGPTYQPKNTQSSKRQPLYPSQKLQSKQSAHTSNAGTTAYREDAYAQLTGTRHPSQQENALDLRDSPDGSEGSNSNPASPVQFLKKPPRPSLSDRTVESLAHMSPAPNPRSGFFNPESPMPSPTQPRSALPTQLTAKQSQSVHARPDSPSKRPNSRTGNIPTPSQRPTPSALPKAGTSSISTPSEHLRSRTARPMSVYGGPAATTPAGQAKARSAAARPMSIYGAVPAAPTARSTAINAAPSRSPPKTAASSLASRKPGSRLSMIAGPKSQIQTANSSRPMATAQNGIGPSARPRPRPVATKSVEPVIVEQEPPQPEKPANSSANLRAQIAKARAAHRKNPEDAASTYNFENCDDPFNTGAQKETSTLMNRIDSARRDGRLNIAALELKELPPEVLNMYDADAMESSSVPWNEVVDLIRLNAADNMIRSIPDKAFRDVSLEELVGSGDERGNQFGGLELLDLHGNQLTRMPMGLRRLESLTVLNLSRNKLDYKIFDVVVQISSLRELRLGENELAAKVPDEIGQLTNLEVLDLQNNKFASFPRTVRDLVNLRTLNLSKNRFADLPLGSIFSLPDLQELYVATNALTGAFFSENVEVIRKLQSLDISNNSLAALSFASELHLPALQYINVSSNRLFAFPDISSWTNLLTLLADENGLSILPPGLTTLKKLRNVDLSRNSLRVIDQEVGNMNSLETLNISANPLRDKKLLSMSTSQIKEDLLKRLEPGDASKS